MKTDKQNAATISAKTEGGKTRTIAVQDIQIVEHPGSSGDYLYWHKGTLLDLTAPQQKQVWQSKQPDMEPFMDMQDNTWLTMRATLTPALVLDWVADSPGDDGTYRGVIVLVKEGARLVIANQLPESACQDLFKSILDAYRARGQSPVVTFCSFD